jgi:ribonuclease HI
MFEESYVIYTDGACSGNPGPGGWAAVILSPTLEVRELGGPAAATTNNRMEMMGVLRGLEAVTETPQKIQVFTDSVYVIRGITQWVFGWQRRGWKTAEGADVVNRDLWQLLMAVVTRCGRERIQWHFIRGHKGVAGNERCDQIAVAFSKGPPPRLYRGPLSGYGYDIDMLPEPEALPDFKDRNAAPKKAYSYLSVVDGVLERHTTWPECETRVKGRSGARFKKAMTAEDEARIKAEWGF